MSHSVYSFSSSHRWLNCPASIRMSKGYVNSTNEAAEKGTAVHELGEFCINVGVNPNDCIGMTFNNFVIDEGMANGASIYRNTVDELTIRYGMKPMLEQRVMMSSLGRNDVYGTADCVFISNGILHVLDYKNGYGLVDVNDNSQTAGYAVATLDTFNLWDKVHTVINTIIQPNYWHIDGPVRHVTYTIADMIQWRETYRKGVLRADNPAEKPVAGEWCHYCPAQANCRARMERYLKTAYAVDSVENVSPAELEIIYSEKKEAIKYLETVEARMLEEARKGTSFTNFKLVESRPRAAVNDVDGLLQEARKLNIDITKLFIQPRLTGVTTARKILPKELVSKYYRVPPASSILVHNSDNRPAMRIGKAEGVFTPIDQPRPSAEGVFGEIN